MLTLKVNICLVPRPHYPARPIGFRIHHQNVNGPRRPRKIRPYRELARRHPMMWHWQPIIYFLIKEFFLKFPLKLDAKKKGQKKWIKRRWEQRRQKVNSSTRLLCLLNETRTVSTCLENFAIAHAWTLKAGSTEGREVLNLWAAF